MSNEDFQKEVDNLKTKINDVQKKNFSRESAIEVLKLIEIEKQTKELSEIKKLLVSS